MGLDMYFEKKTYIGNKWKKPDERAKLLIPKNQGGIMPIEDVKDERISEVTEEVGYWRKANAIHKWFVDNVQKGEDDCGEYLVSKKNIEKSRHKV